MPPLSVDELCRQLVRLQLASPSELDSARAEVMAHGGATEFLALLERRGTLTSYQVSRLQKGETAGLVLGKYKLLYRNAAGSFARVYRGASLQDGRSIGLKVLRTRFLNDPAAVRDFHKEAELGQSLKHENIVPIYEIGQEGDQHYFTMEFVEGGNLRDFINIRKKLSPLEATRCILEMTQGLDYAARRGFLHRDLKMTNVLMSADGVARLVDFGLSGGTDGEHVPRALDYATLEKGTSAPRDDPRSDLFFLGAMYYELLTGIPPLERTRDRNERSQFSRFQMIRPIRTVDPSLPRSVANTVDRLMQLDPALRYQNAGEVVRDLQQALSDLGQPVSAAAPGNPARPVAPGPDRVLMCIESRQKQQDILRQYFTKYGYRVLLLGDLQRGLNRMKTSPPDCLLIMAESTGDAALKGFREAQLMEPTTLTYSILVLAEKQAGWKQQTHQSPRSRVLVQPVNMRQLRLTLNEMLGIEDTAPTSSDAPSE